MGGHARGAGVEPQRRPRALRGGPAVPGASGHSLLQRPRLRARWAHPGVLERPHGPRDPSRGPSLAPRPTAVGVQPVVDRDNRCARARTRAGARPRDPPLRADEPDLAEHLAVAVQPAPAARTGAGAAGCWSPTTSGERCAPTAAGSGAARSRSATCSRLRPRPARWPRRPMPLAAWSCASGARGRAHGRRIWRISGAGSSLIGLRRDSCPSLSEALVGRPWSVPVGAAEQIALPTPGVGRYCVSAWSRDGTGRVSRATTAFVDL